MACRGESAQVLRVDSFSVSYIDYRCPPPQRRPLNVADGRVGRKREGEATGDVVDTGGGPMEMHEMFKFRGIRLPERHEVALSKTVRLLVLGCIIDALMRMFLVMVFITPRSKTETLRWYTIPTLTTPVVSVG